MSSKKKKANNTYSHMDAWDTKPQMSTMPETPAFVNKTAEELHQELVDEYNSRYLAKKASTLKEYEHPKATKRGFQGA